MALTSRWTPLDPVPEQLRLVDSPARFKVVAAGRRSGKTERSKRHIVTCALDPPRHVDTPTYVACAPTRDQAKRIWWGDLKALSPRRWVASISESELTIRYRTGAQVIVVGLDKPQRVEGIPIDGAAVDEIADCRPEAWTASLRPALSTRDRPGWCWFTGRPRGRNHFYDLFTRAKELPDWDAFHWPSSAVLPAEEIESAKRDLDPLSYRQNYEADFVNFEGLAYYQWDPTEHVRQLTYSPDLPLVFCFDFNVEPGVAVILQEQTFPAGNGHSEPFQATSVIGEVWIPRDSNTPAVCRRLIQDWQHHKGDVLYYGDATGCQRRTVSRDGGTDWDIVREYLRPAFPRIKDRVQRSNPLERDRLNSVNTRLRNAAGQVRLFVDRSKAPHVVLDFEGVTLLEGGSGEIDKDKAPQLTHLTDALGYYVHAKHPLGGSVMRIGAM